MIVLKSSVIDFLDDLIYELFEAEYFGYVESSEDYVERIINFIHQNIPTFPSKKTPIELKSFGNFYIFYKINPRTTWYIFFQKEENDFLITHVINNHCEAAKHL